MTSVVSTRRFASRGGDKLDAALDDLSLDVRGLRVLDAGGSTGGWTDCLLQRGAREVVYVDVAYGALDWRVRTDDRVRIHERTNLRGITPGSIDGAVDLAVADLSFISLRTVLPALTGVTDRLLLLVKPQFEAPRADVPRGGVIRSPEMWRAAVEAVVTAYGTEGFGLLASVPSRIPGAKGNREFFIVLARGERSANGDVIGDAIASAP